VHSPTLGLFYDAPKLNSLRHSIAADREDLQVTFRDIVT